MLPEDNCSKAVQICCKYPLCHFSRKDIEAGTWLGFDY